MAPRVRPGQQEPSRDQKLRLGPLPRTDIVRLTVAMPATVKADLDSYAALYRATYDEVVDAAALVPHMLATFMERDRELPFDHHSDVLRPEERRIDQVGDRCAVDQTAIGAEPAPLDEIQHTQQEASGRGVSVAQSLALSGIKRKFWTCCDVEPDGGKVESRLEDDLRRLGIDVDVPLTRRIVAGRACRPIRAESKRTRNRGYARDLLRQAWVLDHGECEVRQGPQSCDCEFAFVTVGHLDDEVRREPRIDCAASIREIKVREAIVPVEKGIPRVWANQRPHGSLANRHVACSKEVEDQSGVGAAAVGGQIARHSRQADEFERTLFMSQTDGDGIVYAGIAIDQ